MSNPRIRPPVVVDLTVETTPQRPLRKRKSTYIDLTTPEHAVEDQPPPVEAADSTRIEIVFESRSTPIPPTRMGRSAAQRTDHVDLAVAAADDADSDLPLVHIPGKRNKSKTPQKSPSLNIPTCSICLETVPELQANNVDLIITTGCRHFFCKPCIVEALKQTKTCPRCRVTLRGRVPYQTFYF